ncbi:MAG: DNA polymerase IV [Treponema sp.]|nr:DNA polymerase IV [Treponema sp.]
MTAPLHWYLHVDLDAFFASVEQLDNPEYRGKPVIVGGLPTEKRSVVSTASYEARKFGVHSAMPTALAYRLCPQGIFLHGRMKRYAELSYQIMTIFKDYSPDVEQMSIDEAFIDLTGTEKLFGPPEETARKLKKEVKEKTGLTVSIGLAPTKYLAKIASGLSKPDGFYMIRHGEEEAFMLNLPLNKVWGLGSKSLELLRKRGINSTRDIHALPYENLEIMFGKNMATFIFEAVRGIEKDSFQRKTKSHSISAETTFSEDITDSYTAETQLLEMAQGVMFRLLKEKAVSKTVMIKIRYNDFSTFTVQETQDCPVSTIDSFYEIARNLFHKKYTEGRGIRLLGIGFENITGSQGPVQQQLFEDRQKEKKEKVEQAILKMKIKNPDIKIQKARTLKSVIALLFTALLLSFTKTPEVFAENIVSSQGAGTTEPDTLFEKSNQSYEDYEESGALFEWALSDTNHVDFSIEGFWKGEFTGGFTASWNADTPFSISGSLPIYKQEVELSANINLNNHWYFSADFADSFKTNTFSIGYTGQGFVRSFLLSNRNINMPKIYSAEFFGFGLSGGKNQAPGISASFSSADDRHKFDVLLRYDATKANSAVFYGMNKVSDNKIKLEDFARGKAFVFPAESQSHLTDIKNIYAENSNGNYTDIKGKRYKKLSAADYRIISAKNMIIFSDSAESLADTILVTFNSDSAAEEIDIEAGSYDDEDSFRGKIQKEFNKAPVKYNLNDYSYSAVTSIQGEKALIIQNNYGFSPFLRQDLYNCGIKTAADLSVISNSTEKTQTDFYAQEFSMQNLVNYEDFFQEEVFYAEIKNLENEESFFPFAETSPEIYLNLQSQSDLCILSRTYSSIESFYIGTKAAAGSIQVYKNGNLENAVYDSTSGNVELSCQVSETDKIVILWQEESEDFSNGAIAAGLGYNFRISPELFYDASLTARIPLSFSENVTLENISTFFTAFSTGIQYEKKNLVLSQKASLALQKSNAAGDLLVCAQSDTRTKTSYLEASSGFEVQQVPQGYESSQDGTVKNFAGIKDKEITGWKIPLQWDFTELSENDWWAAIDIKLSSGQVLKNASEVEFALQSEVEADENTDSLRLFIQLGVSAESEKKADDSDLPVWEITDFDFSSKDWQTVKITLQDKDRARLTSRHDMRLIVSGGNGKGCIYAGPYQIITKSIFTIQDENIIVSTGSQARTSEDFSSRISWTANEESSDESENTITALSYFQAADFQLYKKIRFTFAIVPQKKVEKKNDEEEAALTFILDDGKEDAQKALTFTLNDYSEYAEESLRYHILEVNLENNEVYIDEEKIDESNYSLTINNQVIPSRQKIQLSLLSGNYFYKSGSLYVDNLIYSENDFNYSFQHYLAAEYKMEDSLFIKDYEVLKDGYIKLSSMQGINNSDFSIKSDAQAGLTLAGIRLEGDLSAKKLNFYKAGHTIQTEKPLFSVITLKENYRFNTEEKTLNKEDSATVDFSSVFPLKIQASASASSQDSYDQQKSQAEISSDFSVKKADIKFKIEASAEQKIDKIKNEITWNINSNYFESWKEISSLQFSDGSELAAKRKNTYSAKAETKIPFTKITVSPAAGYFLSSAYLQSDSSIQDTTKLDFSLPIKTGIHTITFESERKAEGAFYPYSEENSSYFSDSENLFKIQMDRLWFYTAIPLYDLFDNELIKKVTADYSSKYQANYSRKLFNDTKDIFIPSSLQLAVSRNIEKEDSISDLYQFKTVLSHLSLNNFGSKGKLGLFSFFTQDELYSSLTGIVKMPADLRENTSFQIVWYLQTLLYINEKSYITAASDFSIENDGAWLARGTFIYTRPSKDCLSYAAARLFFKSLSADKVSITRKNSLNLEYGKSDGTFTQKYDFTHSAEMAFLQYFSITTGFSLSYSRSNDGSSASNLIGINATLGAKAQF